MKYLFLICLCLVFYRFSSHSLRMKVTQATDCTTYKDHFACVKDIDCVWKTELINKCQNNIQKKQDLPKYSNQNHGDPSNGAGIKGVPMSFGKPII